MRVRTWILAAVVPLAVSSWACAPAPRARAVKMGPVETGAASLQSVRRQLEGTWDLTAYEARTASGAMAAQDATGTLTYDAYGNLVLAGEVRGAGAPQLLNYTGRAVIDVARSVIRLEDMKAAPSAGTDVAAVVHAANERRYALDGDVLSITVVDDGGAPVAHTTWKKRPTR